MTPPDRANIFLRTVDNFPTQKFLGPLIVNRPEPLAEEQYPWEPAGSTDSDINEHPSLAKEGCPVGRGGVIHTDTAQREIPTELPSHWPDVSIRLGPNGLKLDERFPFLAGRTSMPGRARAASFLCSGRSSLTRYLSPVTSNVPLAAVHLSGAAASGLSPPFHSENLGHSKSERCSAGVSK
jgi:hypothetical protein